MSLQRLGKLCAGIALLGLIGSLLPLAAQTTDKASATPQGSKQTTEQKKAEEDRRVPLAVAKERAEVLHVAYAATLETIHHHYFRRNQAVLPARAMEEVFDEVARKSNVKARWISVNTKPMSVDHEPADAFEKKAASEISAGNEKYDAVEDGQYRSARSIPLGGGCISCHASSAFGPPPKSPRYAALVISVPIKE